MLNDDCTFATIARRLKRSPSTISREVKRYRCFIGDDRPVDCAKYFGCSRNRQCEDAPFHGCYGARRKRCKDVDCTQICSAHESFHNCPKLSKPPYVCTCCPKQKTCKRDHAYYTAHRAQSFHLKTMRDSHKGIRMTPEELIDLGNLIEPLVLKGPSLNHIVATHRDEIKVSERTLYTYIDSSVFSVRKTQGSYAHRIPLSTRTHHRGF